MSKNDNCQCTGTTKVAVKVLGRNTWRVKPWGDLGKHMTEGADVTCWGRLFWVRAAAAEKREGPIMDSHVPRTFSDSEKADRKVSRPQNWPWTRAHWWDTMVLSWSASQGRTVSQLSNNCYCMHQHYISNYSLSDYWYTTLMPAFNTGNKLIIQYRPNMY